MIENDDKLVYASETPNVGELIAEYKRCTPYAWGWDKIRDNDDVRFARWANQSADGKKKSTETSEAFPWEGASDTRELLADRVINENVATLVVAFLRSVALAKGVEAKDHEEAANYTKLLEWLMGTKLNRELLREVELSAQYREQYGQFILQTTWERELDLDLRQITMESLMEIAAQSEPGSPLSFLPQLIANPETEDNAVKLFGEVASAIVQGAFKAQVGNDSDVLDGYKVKPKRLRKLVRELRDEGVGEIPLPYVCKNQPRIRALKLWEDVFITKDAYDIQNARVFVKDFYSEPQFRAAAKVCGWDGDWVEECVRRKGQASTWTGSDGSDTGASSSQFVWLEADKTNHNDIEVITCYQKQLDEDDIPCVTYTVYHADISKKADGSPCYGKHEKLNYKHKQLPFVFGCRERWHRSLLSSRGVPQLVESRQREIKVQRDSLVDYTSINLIPPINVYANALGAKYRFGPAVRNTVQPGREPAFMDMKGRGEVVAFNLMEMFRDDIDTEFGFISENVPPTRAQLKQQMLVMSFLIPWTEALQQMFALVEQFMPDAVFQEVTGSEKPMPKGEAISLQKDFILEFDVRSLDMENVLNQFKAITEGVLPWDQAGTVDRAKLVRHMLRAVNPSLAKEIIQEPQGAIAKVAERVQQDFLLMMNGMQPTPTMDDNPTAGMELQIAEQIMQSNPKIQQSLQSDPQFQESVKKYFENKQFNLMQAQNRTTGRTGAQ